MRVQEWIDLGKETIIRLLEAEHAVVWPEVEARCADRAYPPNRKPIQPHHLTSARQELREERVIREIANKTRGGREVPFITLSDVGRHGEAIKEAAARKRLLQARYLSWALTLDILGLAGERAVHAALMDVAPRVGYRVVRPEGGPVVGLFGQPLEGPLDDAAHLQVVDERGVGVGVVTVPIEVKNVREWIYADSERLHQLLHKAARLQERFPDVAIIPVLACRRGAYNTFRMAKAFGFYVADAKAQFLPRREDITPTGVEEVAVGLGYEDLTQEVKPNRLLKHHFAKAIPEVAARGAAGDWARYGPQFVEQFEKLRDPALPRRDRAVIAEELEEAVAEILGEEDEEEQPDWEPPFPEDYF